jgi:hypothetical protein
MTMRLFKTGAKVGRKKRRCELRTPVARAPTP